MGTSSVDLRLTVKEKATLWSRQRLQVLLLGQKLEKGPVRIEFSDFKELEVNVIAIKRKDKLSFFFEWTIDVNFIGTVAGSKTEYKGSVEILNLSEENDAHEIEISVHTDTSGPQHKEIRQILYIEGPALVRSQMSTYVRELEEEFSKEIILPVDSKPGMMAKKEEISSRRKVRFAPLKSAKLQGAQLFCKREATVVRLHSNGTTIQCTAPSNGTKFQSTPPSFK